MRTVELAKVAAAAEALRLRRLVRRQGMRAVFGAVAAVFAVAVFVLLHVIAYELLVRRLSPLIASLIILAFDVVVAAIFGVMAMRNSPDAVEREAERVRREALVEMRKSATALSLAGQVGSLMIRRGARSGGQSWLVNRIMNRVTGRR